MSGKVVPLNDLSFQIPLLQTKMLVPQAVAGLVPRPRIHARLDEGLQGKLTLVTAPAGFGKTTAIAQWVRERELPAAWLSLDAGDNDPVRFWSYVTAALRRLDSGLGAATAAMIQTSGSPAWETALSLLIDEMEHLTFDAALVLDDYHGISEPLIHETVSFLVRYAPPHLHPVIAGRNEPPLSLARLRAGGKVAELTARELGFADEEAFAFYTQRDIRLTREEAGRLAERTGGWAAGLQMAAVSLREAGNQATVIDHFGGGDRFLAGYFLEEIFSRFEPDVRDFLLQTSILNRLSGPLADAVTGRSDGGAVLAAVVRNCGLMDRLDQDWYVHHQLFAEFLRSLLMERDPKQVGDLYGRAARWCSTGGLLQEAVDYHLQGKHYDQAATLASRLVSDMMGRGETATLFRWLAALPRSELDRRPDLCVAQAWASAAAGRVGEAEQWLGQADAICRGSGEDGACDTMTGATRSVLEAVLAVKRSDVPGVLRWLAQASQAGDQLSVQTLIRILQPLEPSLLGSVLGGFGRLKAKAQAMESGVHLKFRALVDPADHPGFTLVANAEALYEWNRIDAAVRSLLEGIEEAQRTGEDGALVPALFTLARIHVARGNLTAALAVAAEGEKSVRRLRRPQWLPALAALGARLHLTAGDASAVEGWLAQSRLDVYDRLSAARAYEHTTLARVLVARGGQQEALLLLERLLVFAEKEQRLPSIIEISNLMAIAWEAIGRTAEALDMLRRSLALGRENAYLRSFVDEGAPMLSLLRRLARNRAEQESDFIRQLISLLRASPILGYPGLQAVPAARLTEPLTAKELAVLRLAAQGLERRSIAREMSIGEETVKTHLTGIYGKLGAEGRRDAVRRAKELGILP